MKNIYQIEPRNPAHSILIQRKLFELGYRWDSGQFGNHVQFVDTKYLSIHYCNQHFGYIRWSDIDQEFDEITFEGGVFSVKHYPQLVVPARDKWRDEMELNQTLVGHKLLDDYRKNRDSNGFRTSKIVEQLCEYVLFLEDQLKAA